MCKFLDPAAVHACETVGPSDERSKLITGMPVYFWSPWTYPLSLLGLRMIDVYFAYIDMRSPEKRELRITRKELQTLFGVQQLRADALADELPLLTQPFKYEDPFSPSSGLMPEFITLFNKATYAMEGEYSIIRLRCSDQASEYIFQQSSDFQIRCKLQNLVRLSTRFSLVLLSYLELARFHHILHWDVSLEELRTILDASYLVYNDYDYFTKRALDPALAEIEKVTGLKTEYRPVRKQKRIVGIHFTVPPVSDPDILRIDVEEKEKDDLLLLQQVCKFSDGMQLSLEQVRTLADMCRALPESVVPEMIFLEVRLVFRIYHYLQARCIELDRAGITENRFDHLIWIIAQDIASGTRTPVSEALC